MARIDSARRSPTVCVVDAYLFLSDEWIEAARGLHAEYADRVSPPEEVVRLNVTVVDAPFGDGEILGHLDTTEGSIIPQLGHLDGPDLSVRVPYEVARQMLVDQQYENLMIAFMSGEIEVEGDVTLMMSLPGHRPDTRAASAGRRSRRTPQGHHRIVRCGRRRRPISVA